MAEAIMWDAPANTSSVASNQRERGLRRKLEAVGAGNVELDTVDTTALLVALIKLVLKTRLEVRELQAAVFVTCLLNKDTVFVRWAHSARTEFTNQAKAAREGKGMAPAG